MVASVSRTGWWRRHRLLAAVALSLYAVLVAVSPVLHHDLACHVKSPAHCDACVANSPASRVEATIVAIVPDLPLVGEVAAPTAGFEHGTVLTAASGRAPPA